MTWLAAGLAFGTLGSFHCVGMCGPLALSLPGENRRRWRFVAERLLYNVGRVITYAGLGGLVGAAGRLVSLAGAQQALSIAIGALFVLAAGLPWVSRHLRRFEQAPSTAFRPVLNSISGLYRRSGSGSLLFVGLLNGLLPCGFVYAALATALSAGDAAASILFMVGFGFGTIPAMFGVSLLGRLFDGAWRSRLQRLAPVGLALVGLLLILRGLGVGGLLSPVLSGLGNGAVLFPILGS